MNEEIYKILKRYEIQEDELVDVVPYGRFHSKGYRQPENTHALWFPEDDGVVYIIKCRGDECLIDT